MNEVEIMLDTISFVLTVASVSVLFNEEGGLCHYLFFMYVMIKST